MTLLRWVPEPPHEGACGLLDGGHLGLDLLQPASDLLRLVADGLDRRQGVARAGRRRQLREECHQEAANTLPAKREGQFQAQA